MSKKPQKIKENSLLDSAVNKTLSETVNDPVGKETFTDLVVINYIIECYSNGMTSPRIRSNVEELLKERKTAISEELAECDDTAKRVDLAGFEKSDKTAKTDENDGI